MKKANNVDEYIAGAPNNVQAKLKEIRTIIRKAAPKAEEKISYGMPYYRYHGRLGYFAYIKNHISLFAIPPIVDKHKKELKNYVTGKSTIQFPLDQPLPSSLIKKLIRAQVRILEEKIKSKNKE